MKIQVDTKQDSHDEIRKVIRLLMGIVGNKNVYSNDTYTEEKPASPPNVFDSPNESMNNLMSMFDNAPSTPTQAPEQEKKDDIPELEFY